MGWESDANAMAMAILVPVLLAVSASARQKMPYCCPRVLFTFGDSLTDTGNSETAFSYSLGSPYGETYFKHPADRFSDGRIVIDFLAQAFGLPFLDPYLRSDTSNFTHGVNFACSGATARSTPLMSPYYLEVQVNQLISFRERVLNISSKGSNSSLPPIESFSTGLYFLYIGFNDIFQNLLYNNATLSNMEGNVIPQAIQSIATSVQTLYDIAGARNFLVLTVPGMGCITKLISAFGTSNESQYDFFGCIRDFNDLAQMHSQQLRIGMENLKFQLTDAMILTFDSYELHMNAMANPEAYGLDKDKLLEACCGGGGKYNITLEACESDTKMLCNNPANHISWDGVHFTEGFNQIIANAILSGSYMDPPHDVKWDCCLELTHFN